MTPSLQTRLKALVDKYTPSGWYSAYALDAEELIRTFDLPLDRAQVKLHKVGYGLLPTIFGVRLSAANHDTIVHSWKVRLNRNWSNYYE